MSEFDPFDDDLGAALRQRAGITTGSIDDAHRAVVARAGRIRRRRAAVAGGGAMTALVVGGILLLPRDDPGSIAPADTGDPIPSAESTEATSTTTDGPPHAPTPTTVEVSIPPIQPEPVVSTSTLPTSPASPTSPTSTLGTATPTTSLPAGSTSPATVPSTVGTTAVPSTTTVVASTTTSDPGGVTPAPFTRTYDSSGGSITVNWDGARLSLLSVSPAPGFAPDIKDDTATRIRVDFDSGESDSRIEVRWDGAEITVSIS